MSWNEHERSFTRKRFLHGAAALGALPAAGGLAGLARAATPRRGGTLRASMGSDIRGFDVQRFYDPQSTEVGDLVFSRLIKTDPQNARRLLPDLAVAVPQPAKSGTSYTFRLRDAKFHDGTPVTAEDVKFSIQRLINPKTKSEGGSYYVGLIKDTEAIAAGKPHQSSGIVVVDPRTIRFELVRPHAAFLNLLSIWFASILPKHAVEARGDAKFNLQPVGSGPFKVDSYKPGQRFVLSRFDDYFDASHIYLDGIDFAVAVQPSTAVLRINAGDLDVMADEVPPAVYNQLAADPKKRTRLVSGLTDNCYYLTLNSIYDSPIFKSLQARRAIAMAVNKRRLLQHDQNRGVVATGFWSPKSQYYDPTFKGIPYNPAEGKRLIQAAGVAGQSVELIFPSPGTFYPEDGWAPLIAQDLQQIGLNPKITTYEFSTWLNHTMDKNAIVPNGWSMDVPHGSFVIDSAFTTPTKKAADASNTCCNFSHWASSAVDRLDAIGNTTTAKEKEIAAYRSIMRTVIGTQALWVMLYWPKRVLYHGDRVHGVFVPTNAGGLLASRLWLS